MLGQFRCTSALALYCSAQLLVPVRVFCSPLMPVLFKLTRCSRYKKEMAAARKEVWKDAVSATVSGQAEEEMRSSIQ